MKDEIIKYLKYKGIPISGHLPTVEEKKKEWEGIVDDSTHSELEMYCYADYIENCLLIQSEQVAMEVLRKFNIEI